MKRQEDRKQNLKNIETETNFTILKEETKQNTTK